MLLNNETKFLSEQGKLVKVKKPDLSSGSKLAGCRCVRSVRYHCCNMPGLESLQEMAEVVRKIVANEAVPELQRRLVRTGASIGGARPKSLIRIDGEPWLVKFSEGEDINTPLIEHCTMTLAKSCGVEVAATRHAGGA